MSSGTQPARTRGATSPNQVLAIVCVAMVLANLDLFIVNVGLPAISHDFSGASLEDLSWTLNGYAIAYASLLVFFGRLSERYRRDRSFLVGVAIFTAASAACAAAPGTVSLVVFRVIQAVGAALMTPTSLGLLLASFPPEKRGWAVRTWTAIGGVAAALGPLVGGLLIVVSWRWIFLINVPIGLLAIVIGWKKLPAIEGHEVPHPKAYAAVLVTIGIAALTFGIVKANDWGWASPGIVGSFLASAVCIAAFVWHCFKADVPFVDPRLFHVREYTGAALTMAPFATAFGALLFSVALWEQAGWGWSALKTGIAIAPGPLLVPITSLGLAGKLIARYGTSRVVVAGILIFGGGLAFWAQAVTLEPSMTVAIIGMLPAGVGVGLIFPTLMAVAASSLPASSFATGSGVINMIRQAGIAIGVAMFVAIIGTPATMAGRLAVFQSGWWVMAGITLLGLIPCYALIRPKTVRALAPQAT